MESPKSSFSRFESVMSVRPDDIDMNQHVHSSRYQDYVLAARYDQMARCYGVSMEEFIALGLGWFVNTSYIEYKRPLRMGDRFRVRTWVDAFRRDGVRIGFEILREPNGKLSSHGWCEYTLVSLSTGRSADIPAWIVEKYSV
jgi:acyl-CoA thioester hydrolase/thioesterase-3